MTRTPALACLVALLTSTGALAHDDTAPSAAQPRQDDSRRLVVTEKAVASAQGEPEMICKTEPMLGSRVRVKKTCLTQQQWDLQREEAVRGVRLIEERSGPPQVEGWQH